MCSAHQDRGPCALSLEEVCLRTGADPRELESILRQERAAFLDQRDEGLEEWSSWVDEVIAFQWNLAGIELAWMLAHGPEVRVAC